MVALGQSDSDREVILAIAEELPLGRNLYSQNYLEVQVSKVSMFESDRVVRVKARN